MLAAEESWRYGVAHSALDRPLDLLSLENGSWNGEEYASDGAPYPGKITLDSLDTIVERVREGSSREAAVGGTPASRE